jgi:predicted acetyltransferase
LTVPGGRVPAAGITVAGVLPTHRRRGLLRAMMRALLDACHLGGEPVAYLWATETRSTLLLTFHPLTLTLAWTLHSRPRSSLVRYQEKQRIEALSVNPIRWAS